MFKDISGLDAAADPMPFLRSAVRAARAQLRRFTPVRVRVRREAVRAHTEQSADGGGGDDGGSDDGDGGQEEGNCHSCNVKSAGQLNICMEKASVAARSTATVIVAFFRTFSRQAVAA